MRFSKLGLVVAVMSFAASGLVYGQPQPIRGAPVPVGLGISPTSGLTGFTGGGFTPDGRVLISSEPNANPNLFFTGGWYARVLRHEVLPKNTAGVPDFTATGVWSAPALMEHDGVPTGLGY